MRARWRSVMLHLCLTPLALLFLAPIWLMLVFATLPESEIFRHPTAVLFGDFFPSNLRNLQADTNFVRVTVNSIVIASVYTAGAVLLCSMGGYAFAKYRFKGSGILFLLIIATLTIPAYVTIIPQFILIARKFHLNNTYWGVILPTLANTLGLFFMRQNMLSIPDDLLDSARIDGAGELRIFWRIAIPLVRPALAALAIILFLNQWNDYLWPLIVLSRKESYTIPVALGTLVGLTRVSWGGIMAGTVVATVPFLVLFLVLQRYFIAGITAGAVKD